jgi:four helix bundle protein
MAVRRLDDLVAYQLALNFKLAVYAVVRQHARALADRRYCDQLFDAASSVEANVAEGWRRYVARDMCLFLRYALASLEEARRRLLDGVHRGYFTLEECDEALELANRCGAALAALRKSLVPFQSPGRGSRNKRSGS